MPSDGSTSTKSAAAGGAGKKKKGSGGVSFAEGTATTTSSEPLHEPGSGGALKEHILPPTHEKREAIRRRIGTRGVLVGIKNLGATCYMNALLQTLFMTPEMRRLIIELEFDAKQRHGKNLAYQLQLLFAQMQSPHRAFVDPTNLVRSFGMGDEAMRQQHDVQELNRKMLDVLQEFIDRTNSRQVVRDTFEGEFYDYKQCLTCHRSRYDIAPYQDIAVAIDGIESLPKSLDAFIAPDIIEGITCEHCGGPQNTAKGMRFRKVPQVLSVQIRRIDFNMRSFKREKILQDFELPLEIDMGPWCSATAGEFESGRVEGNPSQVYRLQSVIAHRGTAYHGHYYSYIRVRDAPDGTMRWVKFDDDRVTEAPLDEVQEYIDPVSWRAARLSAVGAPSDGAASSSADAGARTTNDVAVGGDDAGEDFGFEGLGAALAMAEGLEGGGAVSKRSSRVDGHSYYAFYRRYDPTQPWPDTELQVFTPPLAVREQCQADDSVFLQEVNELSALDQLLPFGIFYRSQKKWIDAELGRWTLRDLLDAACRANDIPFDPTTVRLRRWSTVFNVMGESFPSLDMSVADVAGYVAGKPSSNYTLLCIEQRTAEEAAACGGQWRQVKDNDIALTVQLATTNTGSDGTTTVSFTDNTEGKLNQAVVYCDATLQELIVAVAKTFNLPATDVHLVVKDRNSGDGVSLFWNYDVTAPGQRDLAQTRVAQLSLSTGDTIFAELNPAVREWVGAVLSGGVDSTPTVRIEDVVAASQAIPFIARQHLIRVNYTFTSDADRAKQEADDAAAAPADGPEADAGDTLFPAVLEQTEGYCSARDIKGVATAWPHIMFDGRKLMLQLKEELCRILGRDPASSQMLTDGSRREPRNLTACNVRSFAAPHKKMSVEIVEGAPLAPGQSYVDVFDSTENYADPVRFRAKVLVDHNTTTMQDIILKAHPVDAAAPDAVPIDPALFRCRIMPQGRQAHLGLPATKPLLKDSLSTGHHLDDVRVVLQRLGAPESVALTKASLILRVHRWNTQVAEGGFAALGPWQDFVTTKDTPMCAVLMAVSELVAIGMDELFIVAAKPYQLRTQAAVAALPWIDAAKMSNDEALSLRTIVGLLKVETDDILLVRGRSEPWPNVTEFGEYGGPGPASALKKRGRGGGGDAANYAGKGKNKGGGGGEDGKGKDKKRSGEAAINIQFVWEDETGVTQGDGDAAAAGGSDRSASPAVSSHEAMDGDAADRNLDNPDALSINDRQVGRYDDASQLSAAQRIRAEGAGEGSADGAAGGGGAGGGGDDVNLIDFLPSDTYDRSVHRTLGERCDICYDDYKPGDVVTILNCHHLYHRECLSQWLGTKPTCPSCNQPVMD